MHTQTITISNPPWIPESLRGKDQRCEVAFTLPERRILRKKRQIPHSQWVQQHRVLTNSSIPGLWKNEFAPYLAGIMDASQFESVDTVIVCATPQTGKSECVNNIIGSNIDQAPGPVLYVYPDEKTGKENCKDRIIPMIRASARLSQYRTGVADDEADLRVKLSHMNIYFAWAGSVASLANRPVRYLVLDEVDKYQQHSTSKEADPISLAEKRTITYQGRCKKFKISTPSVESGPIWQALTTEAEMVFDYHVLCPDCGDTHVMIFDQIKWPEGERSAELVESQNLAWYECPSCGSKWGDAKRNSAVRAGSWKVREEGIRHKGTEAQSNPPLSPLAKGGSNWVTSHDSLFTALETYRPKKIGFHVPAWLSYFVPLSTCAAAFLRGLKNKNKLKDFMNAIKAEPWVIYHSVRAEERILSLRDERPAGVVPGDNQVACLTAGVDTQDNGFWFEIRAWGYGLDLTSWQVRHGFVESFQALEKILFDDVYRTTDGKEFMVALALQDAMGHRTAEVYDFARQHRRRMLPLQGVERLQSPFVYSQLEFYPNSKKPIPGGLRLLRVNANYFKDSIDGKLDIQPGDPGAWIYHSETTPAWCRSMVVEYIGDDGLWQCPENKDPYAWDCSVYARAAAEVLGVKYWRIPEGTKATGTEAQSETRIPSPESRTWVPQKREWFKR